MGNPTTAQRFGRTTPTRLRIWTAGVLVLAALSAAAMTVAVADTQRGIRRVEREAAPQAQVASDLYFAFSDLDAQTARIILTTGDDDLASAQLDAQLTFNQRLTDVDGDLRRAVAGTTGATDQRMLQKMLDDVASYHETAAAAQWLDTTSPDTRVGQAAPSALAFYSRATDLMHFDLLPAAGALRDAFAVRLSHDADEERAADSRDTLLVLATGLALLGTLVGFQYTYRRRFRRTLNPFLAVATVATLAVLAAGLMMITQQSGRLQTAVDRHMTPYLGIQHARAVAYDATGAANRHAVAPKYGYDKGFAADAATLWGADGKGLLATGLQGSGPALTQTAESDWKAVEADSEKVIRSVDRGDVRSALQTATGIARGQTAMDFYALDVHLGHAAAAQRDAFEAGLAEARSAASGWAGMPVAVFGLVMTLTLLGVRPRLAEYR